MEKNDILRQFIVKKVTHDQSMLKVYKMVVKDDPIATIIVEGWKQRYKFDELAFKNYDYENIKIRVKEVKRLACNGHLLPLAGFHPIQAFSA